MTLQPYYLEQLGITRWVERDQPDQQDPWIALQQKVSQCQLCDLAKCRTQTVFGVGNRHADLVIVGEAPGRDEDLKGEPFVGRAGQLLTEMLQAIGLSRDAVFIANILKCRPPNNRDPQVNEVKQCTPYLEQQLALLQPKLILAVGRISAHYLLGVEDPLSKLRNQRWAFGQTNIPLLVTYHPAYLLRNPRDKAKSYKDLCLVKQYLDSL